MSDQQISRIKTAILPILKQYGINRAGLFGSLVRNEMGDESDIDILIQLPPDKSLFELVDLKLALEERLNQTVDLVEYSTIHPLLEKQILSEEVTLMKRDLHLFVQDILDSIIKIDEYTGDLSQADFLQNEQVQDAVTRRLEIIGEATKNLPRNLRAQYPEVPWQKMAGMRDILAPYVIPSARRAEGISWVETVGIPRQKTPRNDIKMSVLKVDANRLWEVIEQDLPPLRQHIRRILAEI